MKQTFRVFSLIYSIEACLKKVFSWNFSLLKEKNRQKTSDILSNTIPYKATTDLRCISSLRSKAQNSNTKSDSSHPEIF